MIAERVKRFLLGGASTLLIVGASAGAAAAAPGNNGSNNAGNKVTLCHATGSATNPFVTITVNANGAISGHAGNSHQDGRDIIPSFTYNDKGSQATFPGQNLGGSGQATLNNNCVVPAGGQGAGTTEQGSVLGTSTGGRGAASSQGVVPQGGVAAGAGGASDYSTASVIGLSGSLLSIVSGLTWAARRKLV